MKTINKYQIHRMEQTIEMPVGAEILSLQLQDKIPTIWALVDQHHRMESVTFYTYGTDWDVTGMFSRQDFVATYLDNGYAYHVFKVGE